MKYGLLVVVLVLLGWTANESKAAAVCEIPVHMLCTGCAKDIRIKVTRSGSCQVSFTAAKGETSSGTLRIVVLADQAAQPRHRQRPRFARHRRQNPEVAVQTYQGGPRCFAFNGRRYCE